MPLQHQATLFLVVLATATTVHAQSPRVAFRLDDVQDYYVVPSQIAVMEKFKSRNIPLTIGVIGGPTQFGSDPVIIGYLTNSILSPWEVEVACHGYEHEDFTDFPLETQASLLSDSVSNILDTLPLDDINVFIPPYNAFNGDTITALESLGFTHMSSQTALDPRPYALQGADFYRFPVGASTSDLQYESSFEGVSAQETFNDLQNQITVDGFGVVMVHPMEHALMGDNGTYSDNLNEAQLVQLENLIQMVINAGYEIVPIGRLNNDSVYVPPNGDDKVTQEPDPSLCNCQICNCLAVVLNPVQDFYLRAGTRAIVDTFGASKDAITLGVLANFLGNDLLIVSLVRNAMLDPQWDVEIANSGHTYEDFTNMTYEAQVSLLQTSNNKIAQTLQTRPTTFIPPYFKFNSDTINALKAEGFTHMSATTDTDPLAFNANPALNLWRYPAGAFLDTEDPKQQIVAQKSVYGYSVLDISADDMMVKNAQGLPTENVDPAKVTELQQFLQDIKSEFHLVTINGLNGQFTVDTNPPPTGTSTQSVSSGTGTQSTTSSVAGTTTQSSTSSTVEGTNPSSTQDTDSTSSLGLQENDAVEIVIPVTLLILITLSVM